MNFFLEIEHRCYEAQPSAIPPDTQLELLPCIPTSANESCNINVHSNNSIGVNVVANDIWTL